MLLGQSRVFYSMSKDGLLWKWASAVHPKFRTPWISNIVVGTIVAFLPALLPIDKLAALVNMGTLLAFTIVCAGVWILRRRHPNLERPFKTPLVPLVPILGMCSAFYLMIKLPLLTWEVFGDLAGDRFRYLFQLQCQAQQGAGHETGGDYRPYELKLFPLQHFSCEAANQLGGDTVHHVRDQFTGMFAGGLVPRAFRESHDRECVGVRDSAQGQPEAYSESVGDHRLILRQRTVEATGKRSEDPMNHLHRDLLFGFGERTAGHTIEENRGWRNLPLRARWVEGFAGGLGSRAHDSADGSGEKPFPQ